MASAQIPISLRTGVFLARFHLKPQDVNLFSIALRAPGVPHPDGLGGNKSLAQIGDTLLQLYFQLEGRRRGASREQIAAVIQNVASNVNLTQRGFALGIDDYVHNNPSQRGVVSAGLMASTMGALLGAVFLDSGEELAAVGVMMVAFGLTWPEE
ncbi:hypothetical protein BJX99DRAFT_227639 [Aspergillus californicus]